MAGEWEPRRGRRCAEKGLEREQGQAENSRLRSCGFLEEARVQEGTEDGSAMGRLVI